MIFLDKAAVPRLPTMDAVTAPVKETKNHKNKCKFMNNLKSKVLLKYIN